MVQYWLEVYTDYLGNNLYFNSLREYENTPKGKYSCDTDGIGHYNLYLCDNGDVAYDDFETIEFFDKSEYVMTTTRFSDRSYKRSTLGLNRPNAMFAFYLDLASIFTAFRYTNSSVTYTNTRFDSAADIYVLYGIQLQAITKGTVDASDEHLYICSDAYGVNASYNEDYVFTTYMNCNPTFKFVGLPPFLSESNVTSWDYKRKYADKRGQHIWSDSQLIISLEGYSAEQVNSWLSLFAAAGYQQTAITNSLDADRPYLHYEADIDILGFASSASNSTTHYLKNHITLAYSPIKYDANSRPIEYGVMYKIEFCMPTVWDTCGTFVFHDDGLYMFYSVNSVQQTAKIVNENGELETPSITKNETIFSFFFTHQ